MFPADFFTIPPMYVSREITVYTHSVDDVESLFADLTRDYGVVGVVTATQSQDDPRFPSIMLAGTDGARMLQCIGDAWSDVSPANVTNVRRVSDGEGTALDVLARHSYTNRAAALTIIARAWHGLDNHTDRVAFVDGAPVMVGEPTSFEYTQEQYDALNDAATLLVGVDWTDAVSSYTVGSHASSVDAMRAADDADVMASWVYGVNRAYAEHDDARFPIPSAE